MRSSSRFWLRASGAALMVLTIVVGTGIARAGEAEDSCQAAIEKAGGKYFKSALKAINSCQLGRASGKLDEVTNCRPSVGAVTDLKTGESLQKAEDKLDSALAKGCAGVSDFSAVSIANPCASPVDLAALSSCLADDGFGADAERLVEAVFGDEGSLVAKPGAADCQKASSKAMAKLASARLKARGKCLKSLAGGSIEGPCPDADANASLDAALTKASDAVQKSCTAPTVSGPNGLVPGFPCDLFIDATYRRGGSGNTIFVQTRYSRCMLAAGSGVGDMASDRAARQPEPSAFPSGVAAGDATATGFMAWTLTSDPADVTLQVATDAAFAAVVYSDVLTPDVAAGSTVHGEVTGLTAATPYFYRFTQGANVSRTGRILTLESSPLLATLNFSFTGDSNAAFKPFPVLDQITEYDPAFWLYIGDTIYGDDPRSGTGVATMRSEYHTKYLENRDDRALRDLLANVGTYTMWDDHEVTNDFWGTDPAVQTQMAEGSQAFRDFMPLREDIGDPMKLYRSFKVGELAEFFLIDDRQYRDAQADETEPACITGSCSTTADDCAVNADCDAFMLGQVCHKGTCSDTDDPCSVQADCDAIQLGQTCDPLSGDTLPNPVCQAEINAAGRDYLGATQLAWLENGLLNSTATYKFVANGPLFQPLLFVPYDRWEGYTAERTQLLNHITSNSIKNVVFLSTDIHAAILNDAVSSSSVIEAVGGAIGMDPILRELPPSVGALVPALPGLFPSVQYYDIDRFNVVNATVTHDNLTLQWRDGSGQLLEQRTLPAQP